LERGCRTCYGAVDIDTSDYKTIVRNSHYYIIGHLSAVVKPGAERIKATAAERGARERAGATGVAARATGTATGGTTEDEGITFSAFENADGSFALVVQNENEQAKPITVSDGKNMFTYKIPAKAVASFRWER